MRMIQQGAVVAFVAMTFFTTVVGALSSSFVPRSMVATGPTRTKSGGAVSSLSMKLFDWKRRNVDDTFDVESTVLTFDNLVSSPGSRKRKSRKGRGIAAGQGASCGFGMRGQKSRSGPNVRIGFEGGQQPLYRRLPKFVGKPTGPGHTKTEYNIIKLHQLNSVPSGEVTNFDSLYANGLITKSNVPMHKIVVGRDDYTAKDITVQAHKFTTRAREAIESNGGTCQLLKRTTGEVIVEA